MVFTSKEYLVFYLLCLGGCLVLPARFRWVLLLAASYVFYAAGEAQHLALLLAITLITYLGGLLLERVHEGRGRGILLAAAVIVLLVPLFFFKYLGFVLESAGEFAATGDHTPSLGFDLLLPLGISFFTFQALGYLVDIYRREVPAERNPGFLALYIAFFPQLIAGPIERASRLLPQFRAPAQRDPAAVVSGMQLILWGVFKKLVIADNLAPYADAAYGDPTAHSGLPLLIGTVFFAFQIYCDFSAYVDIGRGSARILGIELMRNFDRPYGARSIAEFWRRWHISLSSWFRDYVYIPLGGSRRGQLLTARNLAVVFLLSGLWHGANWTFVVWGGLHGLALILLLWTRPLRSRLAAASGLGSVPHVRDALGLAATFAFVCFAWIFFRAASLDDAWYVATHLFTGATDPAAGGAVAELIVASGGTPLGFAALLVAIAALAAVQMVPGGWADSWLDLRPRWQRWGAYYGMALGVLFLAGNSDAFIYFRF